MRGKRRRVVLSHEFKITITLLAFGLATPCFSQESVSQDNEIIVTARRVSEPVDTVPVAITVIDTSRLDRLVINTPLDLNKIAGLGGAPVGTLTSVAFSLRGQGTAFGGQPGVIPYFAEVPNYPLTYFDLQNVQVIKGPQGTLFGQTSTGGVVLFEPNRPTDKFEGYVKAQVGNHQYAQLEGVLNIPILEDSLAIRGSFQLRTRDGWATGIRPRNNTIDDLNNLNNISGRLSILWRPAANVENTTILTIDRFRNNGTFSPLYYIDTRFMNPAVRNLVPAAVPSIAAGWRFWTGRSPVPGQTFAAALTDAFDRQASIGPRSMFTDYFQQNETTNKGVINQTIWDLRDNIRLRSIFGLRVQTARGATYDQDATDLPLLDFQCRFVPGTTSSDGECAKTGGWPNRTVSQELQLQGNSFQDRLQWQLGAFYLKTGSRKFREDSRPFIVFGNLSGDPASAAYCTSVSVASPCASMSRTNTTSYAVFGQGTFEVVEGVRATAGYRLTWDRTISEATAKPSYRVPFEGRLIVVPVFGESPAVGATTKNTVVDLPANSSYNFSADWKITDDALVYVAHRSGYKAGGINVVADPGSTDRVYGPEDAKDFEIGLKTKFTIGGITGHISSAFYQTWYQDIQQGEIIPGTAQTVTRNLADAKIRGVEFEGTISPAHWFSLAGNVAYTDARYTKWFERSSCAAQFWRPQCGGLPGTTEVTIDHAKGVLGVAGQTIRFRPDRFANTSKWQWSIQPSLHFARWLSEDVTLSANLYHRGPYVDAVAVANSSKTAGVPIVPQPTVYGYSTSDPYDAPGYTLVDLRVDWNRIGGSRFSLSAVVTNATNKIYRVSSASAFEIIGAVYSITGEPRMTFVELKYAF